MDIVINSSRKDSTTQDSLDIVLYSDKVIEKEKSAKKKERKYILNIQSSICMEPQKQTITGKLATNFWVFDPKLMSELRYVEEKGETSLALYVDTKYKHLIQTSTNEYKDWPLSSLVLGYACNFNITKEKQHHLKIKHILKNLSQYNLKHDDIIRSLINNYLHMIAMYEGRYYKAHKYLKKSMSSMSLTDFGAWTGVVQAHTAHMYETLAYMIPHNKQQHLNNAFYHYKMAIEHYACEKNIKHEFTKATYNAVTLRMINVKLKMPNFHYDAIAKLSLCLLVKQEKLITNCALKCDVSQEALNKAEEMLKTIKFLHGPIECYVYIEMRKAQKLKQNMQYQKAENAILEAIRQYNKLYDLINSLIREELKQALLNIHLEISVKLNELKKKQQKIAFMEQGISDNCMKELNNETENNVYSNTTSTAQESNTESDCENAAVPSKDTNHTDKALHWRSNFITIDDDSYSSSGINESSYSETVDSDVLIN